MLKGEQVHIERRAESAERSWIVSRLRRELRENGDGMADSYLQIYDNGDGTCDVYLEPEEDDEMLRVIRGVKKTEGLKDDILRRYAEYSARAEVIKY